jgi:8-oxo-dGTP diphosphatase
MNIGLYGGSFNPVHNGHVAVVREILAKNLVDQVWVVPCKNHAFKKDLASPNDRIKMLNYAFSGIKNVRIDLQEINSNHTNYTSETLEQFKKLYSHNFQLIVGADALNDLSEWHNATYIKDNAKFIAVNRSGYNINDDVKQNLSAIVSPVSNLSSSEVRKRVSFGESISGLVNENVEQYILQNRLYIPKGHFVNAASTVDLIIVNEKGTLLIKRKDNPYKDYWALPGGYLECGKETLEVAAVRELGEETSLKANISDLELVGVYSDPKRDPRGHVISHAYEVKKYSGIPCAADDAKDIGFFKVLPELAFDHAKILNDFYKKKNEQRLLFELRR